MFAGVKLNRYILYSLFPILLLTISLNPLAYGSYSVEDEAPLEDGDDNGSNNDEDEELPKCSEVEYGITCDNSEEEDSWLDDEPYCDQVSSGYRGSCWDRKDYDEITGLYPCKDGSQVKDWKDCNGHKNKDEQGCDENDDYCDLDQGCQRPDIDCIDDINVESGDSKETATGERAYNPNGQHTCGNDETGEEWPCGPDE